MMYRARESRAVSAWVRDCRGAYTHGGETVCAGFHLYRGFVGCPAWAAGKPCSYPCFLKTTFRTDPELREGVAWVDPCGPCQGTGKVRHQPEFGRGPVCDRCDGTGIGEWPARKATSNARAAVGMWLADPLGGWESERGRQVLNAGELGDTLGFPPDENPHIGMLLDLFSSPETNPHGHKLLSLTKAGLEATKLHLEGRQPSENVILSWSAGNGGVTAEPYWPDVLPDRLDTAAWAQNAAWRVRLRIDPLVPSEHPTGGPGAWCYSLAWSGMKRMPELVTIGFPRHRGGRQRWTEEQQIEEGK